MIKGNESTYQDKHTRKMLTAVRRHNHYTKSTSLKRLVSMVHGYPMSITTVMLSPCQMLKYIFFKLRILTYIFSGYRHAIIYELVSFVFLSMRFFILRTKFDLYSLILTWPDRGSNPGPRGQLCREATRQQSDAITTTPNPQA